MKKNRVNNIFFLGFGLGLIISSMCMIFLDFQSSKVSKGELETEARKLGMHYDADCKVILGK